MKIDAIYALYPESFCGKNLAIRKVFAFSDSAVRAENLKARLKTHSGHKSNKCNQSDFSSIGADNFRRHLKTHSRDNCSKCNLCDFAFILAGNLRGHSKLTLEKKSYKCGHCDYASVRADQLKAHLETHFGGKNRTIATNVIFGKAP